MSHPDPLALGTVALTPAATGCGGGDGQVDAEPPPLAIGQAANAIEPAGAAIVRNRERAAVATEVQPEPVASHGPYRIWNTSRRPAAR
jgi:hypothetical protein